MNLHLSCPILLSGLRLAGQPKHLCMRITFKLHFIALIYKKHSVSAHIFLHTSLFINLLFIKFDITIIPDFTPLTLLS